MVATTAGAAEAEARAARRSGAVDEGFDPAPGVGQHLVGLGLGVLPGGHVLVEVGLQLERRGRRRPWRRRCPCPWPRRRGSSRPRGRCGARRPSCRAPRRRRRGCRSRGRGRGRPCPGPCAGRAAWRAARISSAWAWVMRALGDQLVEGAPWPSRSWGPGAARGRGAGAAGGVVVVLGSEAAGSEVAAVSLGGGRAPLSAAVLSVVAAGSVTVPVTSDDLGAGEGRAGHQQAGGTASQQPGGEAVDGQTTGFHGFGSFRIGRGVIQKDRTRGSATPPTTLGVPWELRSRKNRTAGLGAPTDGKRHAPVGSDIGGDVGVLVFGVGVVVRRHPIRERGGVAEA